MGSRQTLVEDKQEFVGMKIRRQSRLIIHSFTQTSAAGLSLKTSNVLIK